MPTIALPFRYRSPYGLPDALTPPTDTVPGFDPNFAQAQNLDSTAPAPPPPDIPPPPRNAGAAMNTTGVKLPPMSPQSGIRKFSAPSMPPPEIGAMDRQVAANTNGAAPVAAPSPIAPPAQAPAVQASATEKAAQDLEAVHAQRPTAPTSNWAQRLGLAILSGTKFAPIANQMMHPKWAAEQSAYENTLADAEARQKEAVEAERSGAYAAEKKEKAASYEEINARRTQAEKDAAQAVKDKIAAQTSTRNQKFLSDRLKGREADATYQGQNDPRPPNYEFIPDPDKPGFGFAVPPAWSPAPKELLPFLPGVKEGDQITHQERKAAMENAAKQQLETTKQQNQPVTNEFEGYLRKHNGDAAAATADYNKDMAARARESRAVIQNNIPGLGPGDQAANLTGQAFMDELEKKAPGTAAQVKAITGGLATLPPIGQRPGSPGVAIRDAVFRYDPQFNEQRAQVRKAFTTGADGKNIGNNNTAVVHLDQLQEIAKAMDNGSFRPGNAVWNAAQTMFGGAAPTDYEGLRQAVAGEMDAALHGTSTIPGREAIAKTMPPSAAPGQMAGIIETNLHTLGAKLNTYHERYSQQIPDDKVWSPILPSARAVFQKHGFDPAAPAAPAAKGGAAPPDKDKRKPLDKIF